MKEFERQYWKEYYGDNKIVGSDDLQRNVGRTKGGISILKDVWRKTIIDIEELLSVNSNSDILELCCGNGQVIGNLASNCNRAVGVDYSEALLKQMHHQFKENVESVLSDALEVNFEDGSFDIVIIYFSIQHFNEKETIELVNRCLNWLRKGGKLFIGDIPNELRKWEYINQPLFKSDYIKRALNNKPMIGYWYQPEFFNALSFYFKNISVKIIEQPIYHINSLYRYDVLIEKNKK